MITFHYKRLSLCFKHGDRDQSGLTHVSDKQASKQLWTTMNRDQIIDRHSTNPLYIKNTSLVCLALLCYTTHHSQPDHSLPIKTFAKGKCPIHQSKDTQGEVWKEEGNKRGCWTWQKLPSILLTSSNQTPQLPFLHISSFFLGSILTIGRWLLACWILNT